MKPVFVFFTFILFCVTSFAQFSFEWVPEDHPTIQDAIDNTLNDCMILVAPGITYVENLVIDDAYHRIIRSDADRDFTTYDPMPEATYIHGGNMGSAVTFTAHSDSVLEGFTVMGGHAEHGGGVHCDNSSPTLSDNKITNNTADSCGGGVYSHAGTPILSNNVISANTAYNGGGIACRQSPALITGNLICKNAVNGPFAFGGGIYCWYFANSTIENNALSGNTAGGPSGRGGGIGCLYFSNPTVNNNLIIDNLATDCGGGVYCEWKCSPNLSNNTLFKNLANICVGGIGCFDGSSLTVVDTFFWANQAGVGPEAWVGGAASLTIDYSDLEGGQASVFVEPGAVLVWGTAMMDINPIFVTGPVGRYDERFYLHPISPCVDAGSAPAENLGMETFWTRTDRVPDAGVVDIGFHYGPFSEVMQDPLVVDTPTLPMAGGTANFTLAAGADHAGRNYVILGSISGTEPGMPLPGGGGLTLPLNWDLFSNLVLNLMNTPIFTDFLGILDGAGASSAQLNMPPVAMPGIVMSYAYALYDPWDFASNPVSIEVVP